MSRRFNRIGFRTVHAPLAGVLFAGLALGPAAHAETIPDNGFMFQLIGIPGSTPAVGQCLIVGDRGFAQHPTRHWWGQQTLDEDNCGFAKAQDYLDNRQGIFKVGCVAGTGQCFLENTRVTGGIPVTKCLEYDNRTNAVYFREGSCTFPHGGGLAIRQQNTWITQGGGVTTFRPSQDPTKCMIFSNNGHDVRPSLHRWNVVPEDKEWCGFGSPRALFENGQALFRYRMVY